MHGFRQDQKEIYRDEPQGDYCEAVKALTTGLDCQTFQLSSIHLAQRDIKASVLEYLKSLTAK